MKFIYSKFKILPTILILMTVCLLVRLGDILEKIESASSHKSNISSKISFINEAFASEHKPATGEHSTKPEHGEDNKSEEPQAPPGLTANKTPKNVGKAYRNNTEAAIGGTYTKEEVELLQNLA